MAMSEINVFIDLFGHLFRLQQTTGFKYNHRLFRLSLLFILKTEHNVCNNYAQMTTLHGNCFGHTNNANLEAAYAP